MLKVVLELTPEQAKLLARCLNVSVHDYDELDYFNPAQTKIMQQLLDELESLQND